MSHKLLAQCSNSKEKRVTYKRSRDSCREQIESGLFRLLPLAAKRSAKSPDQKRNNHVPRTTARVKPVLQVRTDRGSLTRTCAATILMLLLMCSATSLTIRPKVCCCVLYVLRDQKSTATRKCDSYGGGGCFVSLFWGVFLLPFWSCVVFLTAVFQDRFTGNCVLAPSQVHWSCRSELHFLKQTEVT